MEDSFWGRELHLFASAKNSTRNEKPSMGVEGKGWSRKKSHLNFVSSPRQSVHPLRPRTLGGTGEEGTWGTGARPAGDRGGQ